MNAGEMGKPHLVATLGRDRKHFLKLVFVEYVWEFCFFLCFFFELFALNVFDRGA